MNGSLEPLLKPFLLRFSGISRIGILPMPKAVTKHIFKGIADLDGRCRQGIDLPVGVIAQHQTILIVIDNKTFGDRIERGVENRFSPQALLLLPVDLAKVPNQSNRSQGFAVGKLDRADGQFAWKDTAILAPEIETPVNGLGFPAQRIQRIADFLGIFAGGIKAHGIHPDKLVCRKAELLRRGGIRSQDATACVDDQHRVRQRVVQGFEHVFR